jgi:hypothetical protein
MLIPQTTHDPNCNNRPRGAEGESKAIKHHKMALMSLFDTSGSQKMQH